MSPTATTQRARSRSRLRRAVSAATIGALAGGALAAAAGPALAAEDADLVTVDFSQSTGDFRGGASGMLYGLSDEGVPSDPIVAGARPMSVTQKAPYGEQHPNGDPLEVEDSFFRNGGEYLMVNIQDYYPDWPYNGGQRPDDFDTYLDIVTTVVTAIRDESDYAENYIFTPFNEPDGINWYGNWDELEETFLNDWLVTYELIKEIMPEARIAGPGDSVWRASRSESFLSFAKENDVVPDMWTWHELGIDNLANFRGNLAQFRALEESLEIGPLPVNINEYAMRRDMSVPGQIVQWLAMFEDEKVDAQTAYWTFAGNLNDNMAKGNAANGAWWLLKWYADLSGETVELTPPELNEVDTVQGIAAVDEDKRTATVLVGGGTEAIDLELSGLDTSVFGDTVDIQVRESEWTGQEGEAQAPRVVTATRTSVSDDLSISIPNDDRMSAYQVVITPVLDTAPEPDAAWRTQVEAEDTTLQSVQTYGKPMSDPWIFATSGQEDVGSTNQVTSSATWTVDVPEDGDYRLGVTAGVNGPDIGPGSHAVFVDGELTGMLEYEAGFSWGYRGRAEVILPLEAGSRDVSVRVSADGETRLPGSDVSLDKFDLELIEGPESAVYPAHLARTEVAPNFGDSESKSGTVTLQGDDQAEFFIAARENGYYDLGVVYSAAQEAGIDVTLNGRAIDGLMAEGAGSWRSTARVHLRQGINQVSVGTSGAIDLDHVEITRTADSDSEITTIEMEDGSRVSLAGEAVVEDVAEPTNVSGDQVASLGDGADNTATVSRAGELPAGEYDVQVRYSNAERNTGHDYNADVITRFIDVAEDGGESTRGSFRHNYSWNGFWTHTIPVSLATEDGDVVLGNDSGAAPNLDWIAFAPLSVGVTNVAESTDSMFIDVDESLEHYDSIMWLVEQGISTGWSTKDGQEFRPFEHITRDAMAAFLYRYADEPEVTLPSQSPFADITPTNTEFYKEIVWMQQEGISLGWETSRGQEFRPFEPITRDAMAAFVYRFAGEPEWSDPTESPFVDLNWNNTEFFTEITWLESTGITEGWETDEGMEFRPFDETTRDAMAAFLNRYDDLG